MTLIEIFLPFCLSQKRSFIRFKVSLYSLGRIKLSEDGEASSVAYTVKHSIIYKIHNRGFSQVNDKLKAKSSSELPPLTQIFIDPLTCRPIRCSVICMNICREDLSLLRAKSDNAAANTAESQSKPIHSFV